MKILILGGTGAIGTPLIAILRQNQDIQICVTSRSEHSSEENVQYLKADVLNQSETGKHPYAESLGRCH